ncbi:MAG: Ig-like domain-containing protein [Halothiobacillaceae bacterium]|nr:Ig-like domain-containing protein [Halothiobacillaceae bacterium]
MKVLNMNQATFDTHGLRQNLLALGVTAGCIMLAACGGGGGGSSNSAPSVSGAAITLQTGTSKTYDLAAKDSDGDSLSYSIKTAPTLGTATVSASGNVTYTAFNVVGNDSFVVSVSDGKTSTDAAMTAIIQVQSVFDYQFYKVANPTTLNSQVVRYDPNDSNPNTNQKVVKDNVILGSNVFVMSGAKSDDKTIYAKREYAVFLDPNASSETRTASDGSGGFYEYTFYKDNILKRFDAADPSKEAVIFQSSMLPAAVTADGAQVIDGSYTLALNETDIANSYVQLKAYARLADSLKSEDADTIPHTGVVVRVSDSKAVMGRIVAPIVSDSTGKTEKVLINYVAVHVEGAYPSDAAKSKRLQLCETDLSGCKDVANGAGDFFTLAQSTRHVYLAKDKSNLIYAYDKDAGTLAQVSGVTYPAAFDQHYHLMSASDSHGGSGITQDFTTLGNIRTSLAEGATAYVAINYDLDTDTPLNSVFGMDNYMWKHAMVLKLAGNSGTKVYDNGDGVDDMQASDRKDTTMGDHISLVAVKNGKLFFEAASYSGLPALGGTCTPVAPYNTNCTTYRQGWLDTTSGSFPKTKLDNPLSDLTLAYLTAIRVPAVAVGEHIYISEASGSSSSNRVYNIYQMPLADATSAKPATPTMDGRMFFERTAFRSNGVYEGNVLLWNRVTSEVVNATTHSVIGSDSSIETEADTINSATAKSGSNILAGVGGLFGLKMSTTHGGTPFLVSGESGQAGSLVKVNAIVGDWIID